MSPYRAFVPPAVVAVLAAAFMLVCGVPVIWATSAAVYVAALAEVFARCGA